MLLLYIKTFLLIYIVVILSVRSFNYTGFWKQPKCTYAKYHIGKNMWRFHERKLSENEK